MPFFFAEKLTMWGKRVIIKYYGKVYLSERGKTVNERK